MSWVSGLAIYAVIWWIVLFVVLPFGIVTQDESGEPIEPGSVSSAPAKPRLWRKLGITTVLAAVVFGLAWATVEITGFSLQDWAQ